MRKAIFKSPGVIDVVESDDPKLAEGEAIIDVEYCGVCRSDLMPYTDVDPNCPLPAVLGHEFGGTISAISEGSHGFKVGDKVTASGQISCGGKCYYCRAGHDQLCEGLENPKEENLNIGTQARAGAYAEKTMIPIINLVKLPDDFDMVLTGIMEPAAVAYNNTNGISDSNVAIIGSGAIGLLATKMLKLNNNRVIAIDISDDALATAVEKGADIGVNNRDADAAKQKIKDFLKDEKLDYVLIYYTSFATVDFALDIIKKIGEIRLIGLYREKFIKINYNKILENYVTLQGCQCYTMKEFEDTVDLIASGKLYVKDLISKEFSLNEIKDAFEYKLNNAVAKVVIKM